MGAMAPHVDDILGCGVSGITEYVRAHLTKRIGVMEILEAAWTRDGAEISQSQSLAIDITRVVSADALQLSPSSAELWNQQQRHLEPKEVSPCRCELGELC